MEMSKRTTDKETYAGFFREEASGLKGFLSADYGKAGLQKNDTREAERPPQLPVVKPAPETEQKAYWRSLRAFFRSGKGGGFSEDTLASHYPALLSPFRHQEYVQQYFPCWIADTESPAGEEGRLFSGLQELLAEAVERIAPGENDARILKDNLLRLEGIIRRKLRHANDAYKALPVFREAIQEVEAQLSLKGNEGKAFSEDLQRLLRQLPQTGLLLPFSTQAPLHLLAAVIQRHLGRARAELKAEIAQLTYKLEDLLAVEREKSPEAHSPEHLQSTMDFADNFLNFEELSALLPSGGSATMPEERYRRIEKILKTLQQADKLLFQQEASIVLSKKRPAFPEIDWPYSFPAFDTRTAASGHLCEAARDAFSETAGMAAEVFAAMRIAHLEIEGLYRADMHGDYFAHFSWRNFNDTEAAACASVILMAEAAELLDEELNDFSHLLASNLPIRHFLLNSRGTVRIEERGREGFLFRQELGALAIAHRNTFVLQSAAIRPENLHDGFIQGLRAFAPALFHLLALAPENIPGAGPALSASAAVESREFPGFVYDSQKGPKWGSRFDINDNPQAEANWPVHQLPVMDEKGELAELSLAFTFADFAALDKRYADHFLLIPPEYWTESLVPMADYLELPDEEALTKVPYIWLVDGAQQLQRAAVAWPLVLACQDRLDFWHYLQENAGIHSYHVEQATERLRRELEQTQQEKEAQLKAAYEKEIEKTREETARNAMEQLASALLDMELDNLLPAEIDIGEKKAAPPQKPGKETKVEETQAKEKPEEAPPPKKEKAPKAPEAAAEVADELGEAWIETPLCTSCNECIDANPIIFQYDDNKQAYVANPKGGPFADIVKAAAKCPVKIIHPGAPQNHNEENLEEWVKRAEKYQ